MNLLMNYLLHGWRWTGEIAADPSGMAWAFIEHRRPTGMVVPLGPFRDGPLVWSGQDAQ